MAQKKTAGNRSKTRKKAAKKGAATARKKTARKTTNRQPPATRKKVSTSKTKKKPARKKAAGSSSSNSKTRKRKNKKPPTRAKPAIATLGRPRIPADARLDLVFQKDYRAREIFAFLGVRTVRELEQFARDEIVEKLTGPMMETVERIRKALALNNRCLMGDRQFALEFLDDWKKRR